MFANFTDRHASHRHVMVASRLDREPLRDPVSDCWPDVAADLPGDDVGAVAEKNKIGHVLAEVLFSVVYSAGLVVMLMMILQALHRN